MHTLLLIDDDPDVLAALRRTFRKGYRAFTADNGDAGIALLNEHEVDLIICDQRMPGITGNQVLQHALEKRPETIRILLTGYADMESLASCVNDAQIYKYIAKPWDADELKLTVVRALEAYDLKRKLNEAQLQLMSAYEDAIVMLCVAAEGKDEDTAGHLFRVRHYTEAMAVTMGVAKKDAERMGLMSMLHDIGKLSIPDAILKKTGKLLSPEEWEVMRTHPVAGVRILGNNYFYETAREICAGHHENYDGSGYPRGLKGGNIPLSARIVKVADVFDALTTKRSDKDMDILENAMANIRAKKNIMFDPVIVGALQKLYDTGVLSDIMRRSRDVDYTVFRPQV